MQVRVCKFTDPYLLNRIIIKGKPMTQDKIKQFAEWCQENQHIPQFDIAVKLFTRKKANIILNEIEQHLNLPDDIQLVQSPYDNDLYLGLDTCPIDENYLSKYLDKQDNPDKTFLYIVDTYKSKIPQIINEFNKRIEDELENDVVAQCILERNAHGMSIEDLAEKGAIDIGLLTAIENRKQTPSLRILTKITRVLGKKLRIT